MDLITRITAVYLQRDWFGPPDRRVAEKPLTERHARRMATRGLLTRLFRRR